MSNPIKLPFGKKPKAICLNNSSYVLKMADEENAEITMYGEIVEKQPVDWWTGEPIAGNYIIQSEFLDDLNARAWAKSLTIRMSSVGGDAGASILIHNRLRELAARGMSLTCIVDGIAMSGGSLIMCACDNVEVNPSSIIMIHKSWSSLNGAYNGDDLLELAARNEAWDKAQVSIYKRKCGLSDRDISLMMGKTTYMTGSEAVEKGFADKLLEDAKPLEIAASAGGRNLFVRGELLHLTPGMVASDIISLVPIIPGTDAPDDINSNQNGGNTMAKTLEELRAENPELAEALMAEAKAAVSASGAAAPAPMPPTPDPAPQNNGGNGGDDFAQAERRRIQEIDALAGVFDAETINAAKYGEHTCTAQEMVYQAAQKAARQGEGMNFLAKLAADAATSGAQNVGAANGAGSNGAGGTGADTPQAIIAQAKADAKAFNGRKKEVR